MATPHQVLNWDVSGLQKVADNAAAIAEAVIAASNTMYRTIHDDLIWQGEARRSAEDRAGREQTQMRAIATAYDDLSAACAGAGRDMAYPIGEIRTIFQQYVVSPVSVSDDWTVHGVSDWNSEAGIQLLRLIGLVSTLDDYDAQWGAKIAEANSELQNMAPATVLSTATTETQRYKSSDSRADPDRMRTSAAAFEQSFGRLPKTPTDWMTAEALNPKSYDPKYQGVGPEIRVVRIDPVHGQGIVRASQFIEQRDVSNPGVTNPGARDRGDNRSTDPNFDPEHARVATYIDYENGIVVMRQNPSVEQNADGTPGPVKVAAPEGKVWQTNDGSVRIQYDAANPLAPEAAKKPPGPLADHAATVNGDLVFKPGRDGIEVHGTRTDYPSLEVYQDRPDGSSRTVASDPAVSGRSWGPAANLPFHHEIGRGGLEFRPFNDWNYQYDVPGNPYPGTEFGTVGDPPRVKPITATDKGYI